MNGKKGVLIFAVGCLASFIGFVVVALTQEAGSTSSELGMLLLPISLVCLVAFFICLARYSRKKALEKMPTLKYGALNPGRFMVSEAKLTHVLNCFHDQKPLSSAEKHRIADLLLNGDSQPAVVASVQPLLIAAYSEDMDCVAMLSFPDTLAAAYSLAVGSRLITTNCYIQGPVYAWDLMRPEQHATNYCNMFPLIADFLVEDDMTISDRKEIIPEVAWNRAAELAAQHLVKMHDATRTGNPRFAGMVVGRLRKPKS